MAAYSEVIHMPDNAVTGHQVKRHCASPVANLSDTAKTAILITLRPLWYAPTRIEEVLTMDDVAAAILLQIAVENNPALKAQVAQANVAIDPTGLQKMLVQWWKTIKANG
jgi:hypothetical protein